MDALGIGQQVPNQAAPGPGSFDPLSGRTVLAPPPGMQQPLQPPSFTERVLAAQASPEANNSIMYGDPSAAHIVGGQEAVPQAPPQVQAPPPMAPQPDPQLQHELNQLRAQVGQFSQRESALQGQVTQLAPAARQFSEWEQFLQQNPRIHARFQQVIEEEVNGGGRHAAPPAAAPAAETPAGQTPASAPQGTPEWRAEMQAFKNEIAARQIQMERQAQVLRQQAEQQDFNLTMAALEAQAPQVMQAIGGRQNVWNLMHSESVDQYTGARSRPFAQPMQAFLHLAGGAAMSDYLGRQMQARQMQQQPAPSNVTPMAPPPARQPQRWAAPPGGRAADGQVAANSGPGYIPGMSIEQVHEMAQSRFVR